MPRGAIARYVQRGNAAAGRLAKLVYREVISIVVTSPPKP
ncbi:hypothetical protein RR42_s1614 [Cupriavidus basilensis]|uniref:Uncharacterized protein n=1 Tax=Cupriavidus basilensis TaxID=68895 RepID=A0A0C4YCA4_9BURK|nr:hypothetical protein RR42_s1614 [Cupriavidus basilensis]